MIFKFSFPFLLVISSEFWIPSLGQVHFPGGNGNQGGGQFQQQQQQQQQQSPRPLIPGAGVQDKDLPGCNCIPANQCPAGYGQLQTGCVTEKDGTGICCLPQQGVVLNRIGFTSTGLAPKTLSQNSITKSFDEGKAAVEEMAVDQKNRLSSGKFLQRGSPERGHAYFFQRNPESVRLHEMAFQLAQTSLKLAKTESLTPQQSFFNLPQVKIGNTLRSFQCPAQAVPRCVDSSKYRSKDGSCNNLRNPNWGKSQTALTRLSPALYNDGIMAPRTIGVDGRPLPSPRKATNFVLIDVDNPSREFTLNVMQWAQFMDHDLTHVPFPDMNGEAIMCCDNGRIVSPLPAHCFPIELPSNDGFYAPKGQSCINFVRSMLAVKDNCALGPVEQMNALTHWVDGSMIYGSSQGGQDMVADTNGFMKLSANNLPPTNASAECAARVPGSACFVAGDSRINEQPALTAIHTVWIREHNRIARALQQFHPEWDGNTLFEETKRIVVAEVQHITYNEWLPIIIGPQLIQRFGMNLQSSGYRTSYDPNADPRIFNEFAAAAFRFGHSLIQGLFSLISTTGRQSTLRLRDVFNAPNIIANDPGLIDAFIRALTTQSIQSNDNFVTQEVTNHLFQTPRFNFGMDLMSLNVQRGRDHAIATYNQMRQLAGLPRAKNFADLQDTIPAPIVRRIQTVYENVDDIDLFVGGMAEKSLPQALLGPTFAFIVGKQFEQLMKGDRFFYDLGGQAGSFTPEQLQEIRKSSDAKVDCDNTNVGEVQPLAFRVASNRNQRVPCSQIPGMDLRVF